MQETLAGKWPSLSEKDKQEELERLPIETRMLLVELVSYIKVEAQTPSHPYLDFFEIKDIQYTKDLFQVIFGASMLDVKGVWKAKNPFQHSFIDINAIDNFLIAWLDKSIIFDAILLYKSGFLKVTFKEDIERLDLFFKTPEGKFASKHLQSLETLAQQTTSHFKEVECKKLERLRLVLKRSKIISEEDREELEIIASLALEGIATAYVPIKNFEAAALKRAFKNKRLAWKTSKGLIYNLECRNPKTNRILKGSCILTLKGFRKFKTFLRSCYVVGCPDCTPTLTQREWEEVIREEQKEARDVNG